MNAPGKNAQRQQEAPGYNTPGLLSDRQSAKVAASITKR